MPESPANVNITSALPDDIRESVASVNLKVLGEQTAALSNLAFANAVSHQNRMNVLAEAVVGRIAKDMAEVDPSESVAIQKLLSGNDLAQNLSALGSAIAQIQQLVKGAQTTPPVTAGT